MRTTLKNILICGSEREILLKKILLKNIILNFMIFQLEKSEDILTGETSMNLSKTSLEFLNPSTIFSDTNEILFFQNEDLLLFRLVLPHLYSEKKSTSMNLILLWGLLIKSHLNSPQKYSQVSLFLRRENTSTLDTS